jgi:ligand-binding sensor domain-containing protein
MNVLAMATGWVLALALVAPRAGAAASGARAVTDLDDALACAPLEGGALAIGTGGGLVLVDRAGGARAITALDGLPGTRVYAVAPSGGSLWVGTEGGAAEVAPAPELRVERVVSVSGAAVRAVLPQPDGVYLGTWGAGVARIAPGSAVAEPVRGRVPGSHVAALAEHQGSVYVAYGDGPLAVIRGGSLREAGVAVGDASASTPTHGQALVSVADTLWLGDLEGLFRVERDRALLVSSVDARALAYGPRGVLVGTFGAGLLAAPARGAPSPEPGVPRFVRGVGALGDARCAATADGVYVDAPPGDEPGWRRVPLGALPSNDVTAVAASGDRVAIGTFDRGAAVYRGGVFHPVEGLEPDEAIEAAAWLGEGAGSPLLLGTAHGLVRVGANGAIRRWRAADGLPSSFVRAILVLPDRRVLVGTDEGPAYVDVEGPGGRAAPLLSPRESGKGVAARSLASPMRATWALARSADGTLWIGTTAGLYYGQGTALRRAARVTGELPDDWVTALAVDGADVFVGTYSGGVTRLRAAGGELHATHLAGGYVNPGGLTVLGDRLYAATMAGALVRARGDDAGAWATLDAAAPGRDVTAIRAVADAVWFASRRGIGVAPR